jgi:hypothetical protein
MEQYMDTHFEKIKANMDAYYEGMIVIIKECLGRPEAKKEPAPVETEAVAEPQEVPEEATTRRRSESPRTDLGTFVWP